MSGLLSLQTRYVFRALCTKKFYPFVSDFQRRKGKRKMFIFTIHGAMTVVVPCGPAIGFAQHVHDVDLRHPVVKGRLYCLSSLWQRAALERAQDTFLLLVKLARHFSHS
jgi:hypothetical protein